MHTACAVPLANGHSSAPAHPSDGLRQLPQMAESNRQHPIRGLDHRHWKSKEKQLWFHERACGALPICRWELPWLPQMLLLTFPVVGDATHCHHQRKKKKQWRVPGFGEISQTSCKISPEPGTSFCSYTNPISKAPGGGEEGQHLPVLPQVMKWERSPLPTIITGDISSSKF